MSGYCSMGSELNPMIPRTTMIMDMTNENMGRSMKNLSFINSSLRDFRACADQPCAFRDDLVAGLQPGFHDVVVAVVLAEDFNFYGFGGADDDFVCEYLVLNFKSRRLRDDNAVLFVRRDQDCSRCAAEKDLLLVRKERRERDRPCRFVDNLTHELQFSRVFVKRAVAESELHGRKIVEDFFQGAELVEKRGNLRFRHGEIDQIGRAHV